MTWTLFGVFFVLVVIGVPITFSLGIASQAAIPAAVADAATPAHPAGGGLRERLSSCLPTTDR